jgi:hypothetical protein
MVDPYVALSMCSLLNNNNKKISTEEEINGPCWAIRLGKTQVMNGKPDFEPKKKERISQGPSNWSGLRIFQVKLPSTDRPPRPAVLAIATNRSPSRCCPPAPPVNFGGCLKSCV